MRLLILGLSILSSHAAYEVTTIVGGTGRGIHADGTGPAAKLQGSSGVAVSNDGATLYVAAFFTQRILEVDIASKTLKTIVGDGTSGSTDGVGTNAHVAYPEQVALSPDGTKLYWTGQYGSLKVREMVVATKQVTSIAGSGAQGNADGDGAVATFKQPRGVAVSKDGTKLFVADSTNIRQVDLADPNKAVTTLAGDSTATGDTDGVGPAARFLTPHSLALSSDGTKIYVAEDSDTKDQSRIREIEIASKKVTTILGPGTGAYKGIVASPDGTKLYTSDGQSGDHLIREVDLATKTVTTIAGHAQANFDDIADGTGSLAGFAEPRGLAISPDGLTLYVTGAHAIRQMTLPAPPASKDNSLAIGLGVGLGVGALLLAGVAYYKCKKLRTRPGKTPTKLAPSSGASV